MKTDGNEEDFMSAWIARRKAIGVRAAALTLATALPFGFASALDTSLQTDFWDTSGYVNAEPNVAVSHANAADFVSFSSNEKQSVPLDKRFSSCKTVLVIIIR